MIALKFSLYASTPNDDALELSRSVQSSAQSHNVIWFAPKDGETAVGTSGAGNAEYALGKDLSGATRPCIRFEVTRAEHVSSNKSSGNLVTTQEFTWPTREAVLRLDQVTFPANAVAYRHIHAGAGFRYLTIGGLEIDTGQHQQLMQPGDNWFEDVNSPVKATAKDGCVSQFIRAMIIPVEFKGKTTINILDPKDAAKPTLQSNHRFIDQVIAL